MTIAFEPPIDTEVPEFWEATRDRRLSLPWCIGCEQAIWYPRTICPRCLGEAIEWRDADGTGTIYAYSVHHTAGMLRDAALVPYVVALVELVDGVRMMSNIVDVAVEDVHVGQSVGLQWIALPEGRHLPVFGPGRSD